MKCPKCGEKVVRFPLKDDQGKRIWKNYFKMDMTSVVFFVVILALLWAYQVDHEQYEQVREDPCGFCAYYNEACVELPDGTVGVIHGPVQLNMSEFNQGGG